MKSINLKIERQGTFAVHFEGSNATQCGALGTQVLNYNVRIGCSEEHLNHHGFIIDNNDIHAYFVQKYQRVQDFESCERIAAKACRDFRDMLYLSHPKPTIPDYIEVTVSGSPTAGLTASWTRDPNDDKLEELVNDLSPAIKAEISTRTKEGKRAPRKAPEPIGVTTVPGTKGVRAVDLKAFQR